MACRLFAAGAVALALSGCAGDPVRLVETIEVPVIVERPVLPPSSLTDPIPRPATVFVGPDDPTFAVGLSAGGATFVKDLISRDAALREWAEEAAAVDSAAGP